MQSTGQIWIQSLPLPSTNWTINTLQPYSTLVLATCWTINEYYVPFIDSIFIVRSLKVAVGGSYPPPIPHSYIARECRMHCVICELSVSNPIIVQPLRYISPMRNKNRTGMWEEDTVVWEQDVLNYLSLKLSRCGLSTGWDLLFTFRCYPFVLLFSYYWNAAKTPRWS